MKMEELKNAIDNFCLREYDEHADFSNVRNVGIAYTTTEDDEHDVDVVADLINRKIEYRIDKEVKEVDKFETIEEMADVFSCVSFDDLVSFAWEGMDYLPF